MPKIQTVIKLYKKKGWLGLANHLRGKFFLEKTKPIKKIHFYLDYFKGKNGIEIGGPSLIFSKEIPIYKLVESLDGCNFSNQTVWEGNLIEGKHYNYFEDKKGHQYICEASNLEKIPSDQYDFLIASHCLEHCANTLKTINEWLRVVKKGGVILLVLPDKRYTFDHKRSITKFEHLLKDFDDDIDETDLTHFNEIVALHDLKMDIAAGTISQFKNRSIKNYENRCLHHHVFDFKLLTKIFKHNKIAIMNTSFILPYHQIILGIKK